MIASAQNLRTHSHWAEFIDSRSSCDVMRKQHVLVCVQAACVPAEGVQVHRPDSIHMHIIHLVLYLIQCHSAMAMLVRLMLVTSDSLHRTHCTPDQSICLLLCLVHPADVQRRRGGHLYPAAHSTHSCVCVQLAGRLGAVAGADSANTAALWQGNMPDR